jgi:hypothetical protein
MGLVDEAIGLQNLMNFLQPGVGGHKVRSLVH